MLRRIQLTGRWVNKPPKGCAELRGVACSEVLVREGTCVRCREGREGHERSISRWRRARRGGAHSIRRSLEDDAFRQQLLADPKGAVEQELGSRLPEGVEVRALEETADTVYLVLPSAAPSFAGEGGEIPDRELEAVAGGADGGTWGDACKETVGHI